MTALDIIFIFLVGLGLVFGIMRGFVKEVLSLTIWAVAIVALRMLHAPLSAALVEVVGTVSGAFVLAFAVIALTVFVIGKLLIRHLSGRVKRSAVGPLDRILGGGFGVLKGLLGVTLIYMAFSLVYDTIWGRAAARPEWVAQARSYAVVHAASASIVQLVEARRGPAAGGASEGERAQPQ